MPEDESPLRPWKPSMVPSRVFPWDVGLEATSSVNKRSPFPDMEYEAGMT